MFVVQTLAEQIKEVPTLKKVNICNYRGIHLRHFQKSLIGIYLLILYCGQITSRQHSSFRIKDFIIIADSTKKYLMARKLFFFKLLLFFLFLAELFNF